MTRPGVIASLFCAFLGAAVVVSAERVAQARPGVVKTTDGQSYEGEIDDKNADFVIVNVKGIETRIARDRITSIDASEGFDKEFRDKLNKLDAKDAAGRIALAREAFDARKYTLARDA